MKMRRGGRRAANDGSESLEVLVLPRIIALVVALPILAFIGSMAALVGGGVVASIYGMDPSRFVAGLGNRCQQYDEASRGHKGD